MTRIVALTIAAVSLLGAARAGAQERYALVVSGASGGPAYAEQYGVWADDLARILRERMKFAPANVTVLEEEVMVRPEPLITTQAVSANGQQAAPAAVTRSR